jgi:reverse gyrase
MIGTRRAEQCVPVSQLLWCIVLVKENLWEYLRNNENLENTTQIFGELELMQMVDQFFDRAMYFAVRGHERVREARIAEMKK